MNSLSLNLLNSSRTTWDLTIDEHHDNMSNLSSNTMPGSSSSKFSDLTTYSDKTISFFDVTPLSVKIVSKFTDKRAGSPLMNVGKRRNDKDARRTTDLRTTSTSTRGMTPGPLRSPSTTRPSALDHPLSQSTD